MKKSKQLIAGVVLIPGVLGAVAYGATYTAAEKKADSKQTMVTSSTLTKGDMETITASHLEPVADAYAEITPSVGVTTFHDKFSRLTATDAGLEIQTNSHGNGTALIQAYRQEITLDDEISKEFFTTKDFQKYISGTVTRSKDSLGGGKTTKDISQIWGNSGIFGGDRVNYDSNTGRLYYQTAKYTVQLVSGVDIAMDMKIDLKQWSEDTGKLVERKSDYRIKAKTDANSAAIGFTDSIKSTVSGDGILNSWIENPVEKTTLFNSVEKPSYFSGNGLQDEVNEHPTDYDVELSINGQPYKYIPMASEDGGTNSLGETIQKGDWEFDFGSYLNTGDKVTARVRGKEKYTNIDGNKIVKYSEYSNPIDLSNTVPWEEWEVNSPVVSELFDEDLMIPVYLPEQNEQADRSYKLLVTVNGEEVYNKAIKNDYEIIVPYIEELEEGDVVTSTIIGSQPGEDDKSSDAITTVVKSKEDSGYDKWEIQDAIINGPLYEEGQYVSGKVPIQSHVAGRTYDLKVYIGDKVVIDEKNIDVDSKSHPFSYELEDYTLKQGDEVKAVVTGHQPKQDGVTYPDKNATTTEIVKDNTGYDSWKVNKPHLDKMVDTDTVITGNIGEQNIEAGRTYKVALSIDGEDPIYAQPQADGSFEFKDAVLKEGEQVSATVIGSQDNREDKESEATVETVTDATNYDGWKVNKPTVNALEDGTVAVTGTIGEQNKEFGRTYDVEVFVNGETQGAATVAADGTFATKEMSLKEGDKVTAKVTGHQEGKADKTATSDEVIVTDASHYDEWTVAPASLDEVFAHADSITGKLPKEDASYGRNYEIIVKVDGEEVARNKVEANQGAYTIDLPETVDLKEGQTVSEQVVGHQEGKEDKFSSETSVKVQEQVFTTASNFKNGYWQNYGLVYEGQIDNQGWDMSDGSRVTKTAQLVNHTTGAVVTEGIKAANTNWYDSSRYNGYQIIISNDVLGKLDAGEYTIQLTVAIDGETKETIDLALDQVISRMGPMHDNYADLEEVVIERNTVTPKVIDNKPGFTITKDTEASVQVFNKYWNASDQLIIEGYVRTSADLTDVTKKLIIKDMSGETVKICDIQNFGSSWGIPVDVDESQSFQAIVPNAYSNQSKYTYELVYTNTEGVTLLTEVLK